MRRASKSAPTPDELVALSREEGLRPPPIGALRERVDRLRDLLNVACDRLLLALADPTSDAAVVAAELGSNVLDGLDASTNAPDWSRQLGNEVVDAVWACHDARAILSWAPEKAPECTRLLGEEGKGGPCGMPVPKGAATCWRCAMGREPTMAGAEAQP